MNRGFNVSKCVKIEPLYEGWLCSGVPRVEGNPRQVSLRVETRGGFYNLWIQNGLEWVKDKLEYYHLTSFYAFCPRCAYQADVDVDPEEVAIICLECENTMPLRGTKRLIERFCFNYFQHSQVNEYIHSLQVTWLWMAPQLGLPKEIAVKIAYLLEKQEVKEEFPQKDKRAKLK